MVQWIAHKLGTKTAKADSFVYAVISCVNWGKTPKARSTQRVMRLRHDFIHADVNRSDSEVNDVISVLLKGDSGANNRLSLRCSGFYLTLLLCSGGKTYCSGCLKKPGAKLCFDRR